LLTDHVIIFNQRVQAKHLHRQGSLHKHHAEIHGYWPWASGVPSALSTHVPDLSWFGRGIWAGWW